MLATVMDQAGHVKAVAAHPQSLANSAGTLASDIVYPLGSDIL